MKQSSTRFLNSVTCLVMYAASIQAGDRPEILIADFETDDYGQWAVTGTAFGAGPAHGTLPNQMPVSGFRGKRLVNSYFQGDGTMGTLTSPPFRIERRFINFLIGGGKYPNETSINLIVGGKVVRTETGPNDRPGGSELLDWASWDVADLAEREAVIQIVDTRTGGWGHINIDHIVQGDRKLQAEPAEKLFVADARYLLLPVKTGETVRRMRLEVDGQTVREWEVELAETSPQFQAFVDLAPFRNQKMKLTVEKLPPESRALDGIHTANELPVEAGSYREPTRPGFHFTSRVGWLNDPNGLVYHAGEWHLFYQHNPYGWNWGNMHWGHAVSADLMHWQQLPTAIYPKQFGDWAFSGSAVVDQNNSSGWQRGDEPPLVAAFTSTARGECISYSSDRGRTWTEFVGNPVVKHQGRDPRILWHPGSKQWVMAVYDEFAEKRWIAFHTSPDLKQWQFRSRIEGFYECPDLIELPVEGTTDHRWVLYAADGKYVLGDFDGSEFRSEPDKQQLWYGNFYAAQTFSDAPRNRHVQIGWGNGITFPGQPFNQQMTIPCELALRRTSAGVRMFAWPVTELLNLRDGEPVVIRDTELQPDKVLRGPLPADLYDAELAFKLADVSQVTINLRGVPVVYNVMKQELTCLGRAAPLRLTDGHLRLRLLLDRGSLEIFANDGAVAMSIGVIPAIDQHEWTVSVAEGSGRLLSAAFHPLKSIFP